MFDSQPTPLDLNFRVGPFPVRVSPWFFVGMAFLGWHYAGAGILVFLTWIACGFLSILVHELGHAVAARSFGRPSQVNLIALGGYCAYYDGEPPSGWRRMVTALAGPAAGLSLAALVYVSDRSTGWSNAHFLVGAAWYFLLLQNVFWSVFNLFPLWPLDGGRALREVLYICGLRRPDVPTHWAGMAGAITLGVLGIMAATGTGGWLVENTHPLLIRSGFLCILVFGLIAFQNWQMLQFHARAGRYNDPDPEDDENDRKWRGYR